MNWKIVICRFFRICLGLVLICLGGIFLYYYCDYIFSYSRHGYGGYVPEHYGIIEKNGNSSLQDLFTSGYFYLSLFVLFAGVGLVSLQRWGKYLAIVVGVVFGVFFLILLFNV